MICCTKEKVTLKSENLNIFWQVRYVLGVSEILFICPRGHPLGNHGFTCSADEEEDRQQDASLNGNHEINKDRQEEGDDHDSSIASRTVEHGDKAVAFAHVVGNNSHNAPQRCHGDQRGKPAEEEHDQYEDHRMHDAGNRGYSPVFNIRRRARDGACGRNATKEWRAEVCDALANEFGVGVVTLAGHTVRNNSGEKRLDTGKESDGDGRGHHRAERFVGTGWPVRHWNAHAL